MTRKRTRPSIASSKRTAHAVDAYAADVRTGAIVAGPLVRAACLRHERDRAAERWIFDEDKANRAIHFFRDFLRLPDTVDERGEPIAFLLQPWQVFVVGSLFGWVDSAGLRRYRDGYIETGKGSGKTPLLAGIGLYGLTFDRELAAEIYAAAVDRDQAMIMFRDATRIVAASPKLAERVHVSVGNLSYPPLMSFFRPFSREQGQKSGTRPHFALIDEVHEHPTAEIVTKIKAGVKRRAQPLVLEITNSGTDRQSIAWAHHEHARRVVDQVVEDERFFAYVCALDEGDDPLADPSCWPKANPTIDVTITREYLERQVENAKNIPAETNSVLRLNFCVWTQAVSREFDPVRWRACAIDVPDAQLVGRPCYGGLDLGLNDDFSAFVLVWPLEDGRVVVRPTFWIPRGTLETRRNRPYSIWLRDGALRVTEGDTTDLDMVEATVGELCHRWGVREVAYDKRFAQMLALHLEGDGITMIDTPQGYDLNEAIVALRGLVKDARLCHGGHSVLAWMADNFTTRKGTRGEVRPDKPSAAEKIDGIVALCMALDRIVRHEATPEPQYQMLVLAGHPR